MKKNNITSFSLEEVKKIANEIMNLGMELRQNQLNGSDTRSGNQVLKEYFDKIQKENLWCVEDKEITKMAIEMIYQITGEKVPEEEQCIHQGNVNYQIAMTYLTKVNNG